MPETTVQSQDSGQLLSDADKWELVKRVAAAAPFQKSARLREFLLYVCDRSLKNRSEDVREQQIGSTVFGRPVDYNPSEDNIVRVEARQLRKRLADYFAADGKAEPWLIEIPKGSYLPVFLRRQQPAAEPVEVAPVEEVRGNPVLKLIAVALILLLAAACLGLLWLNQSLRQQRAAAPPVTRNFPWNLLFDANHQTNVVVADSCLVLLQDVLHEHISLSEYLSRAYLSKIDRVSDNPALRSALQTIAARQYTSLADVTFVRKVAQLDPGLRDRIRVVYARNLNIRDFKSNHMILLGTTRANPWVELFEPKLNFDFVVEQQPFRAYFRNKAPKPGERDTYVSNLTGNTGEGYAVVALLPNLDHTGNVLLIEGCTMEGTEAGWEFLTDPAFSSGAVPRLGVNVAGRHFEILLKLHTVGGTSQDTEPIAYRLVE
jgi:hypothetical protein